MMLSQCLSKGSGFSIKSGSGQATRLVAFDYRHLCVFPEGVVRQNTYSSSPDFIDNTRELVCSDLCDHNTRSRASNLLLIWQAN